MGDVLVCCGGISIHALREEGDRLGLPNVYKKWIFLSTPSARRATGVVGQNLIDIDGISIHALREEGDILVGELAKLLKQFLSTPSARRATDVDRKSVV